MIATGCTAYTPDGLTLDPELHAYAIHGEPLVGVTEALRVAGLVDLAWYVPGDRERGSAVAQVIAQWHLTTILIHDPAIERFVVAYMKFLAESAFHPEAVEELVCDPLLHCAGTLDLRGTFPDEPTYTQVIDVKTGTMPPWVGYQTAGYVALLPRHVVRRRVRRWCLHLKPDGTYRLVPLVSRADEAVFRAAVTIAHARRGWL
jgi:hypothetical protein